MTLTKDVSGKLVKYPTLFDDIPHGLSSLLDYLQAWEGQSGT
ncbi:MAG: hypothetical protein Q9P44_03575 [Anaerolineae bacterium]|nr:hypothetical protein [Anaerolineae bacterium]